MEFFALIGFVTVAWIIYDLTKYIFIDYYKEEQEEQESMAKELLPERFVLDRSDNSLYDKVFEPIDSSSRDAVAPINRSLKKIGTYVRLYYHLINLYDEYIDEDPALRIAIYRIELFRREIQDQLISHQNQLDNAFRMELGKAANTILFLGGPIIEIYEKSRDWCLSREISSKLDRLNRIYCVLDTEKTLFIGYPDTKNYYAELGEKYLDEVFNIDEETAKKVESIRASREWYIKSKREASVRPNEPTS